MGQAKLRGSFEQRKAAAVARELEIAQQREWERQQRKAAWARQDNGPGMGAIVQTDEVPQVFADSRHSHRAALRTASIAGLLAASLK